MQRTQLAWVARSHNWKKKNKQKQNISVLYSLWSKWLPLGINLSLDAVIETTQVMVGKSFQHYICHAESAWLIGYFSRSLPTLLLVLETPKSTPASVSFG